MRDETWCFEHLAMNDFDDDDDDDFDDIKFTLLLLIIIIVVFDDDFAKTTTTGRTEIRRSLPRDARRSGG